MRSEHRRTSTLRGPIPGRRENGSGQSIGAQVRRRWPLTLVFFCSVLALELGQDLRAAGAGPAFADGFADRALVTDESGALDGNNATATREVGEPLHGGKTGGRSLWISWRAPADGVATFRTDGSTFDTLLSAYYFASTNDTTLDKLREAARNDDAPGLGSASLIQFGALAGVRYEIAVDGFSGAAGDLRLRWNFLNATSPPPIVVRVPDDQSFRLGDPVTLTIELQTSTALDLQWRFNDNSFDATGPTLFIPSMQETNVGRYSLRIRIGSVRFETTPVELQINSDGQTNALARDKLFDSFTSPLVGKDGLDDPPGGGGGGGGGGEPEAAFVAASVGGGVVRGYNGSQIFDTSFATTDTAEPTHCTVSSGATYWLSYQPPTNGTVTLDTSGSSYDTVLAVYTYDASPRSYADLIPVTCDNDAGGVASSARVMFAAVKARQYAIVIAGVNGATGIAHLNYFLDAGRPPIPLTVIQAPGAQAVPEGSDVVLEAEIQGSPPLIYTWRKGGLPLPAGTNSVLRLFHVDPSHSGEYSLSVSNLVGAPITILLPLRVLVPPSLRFSTVAGGLNISFPMLSSQSYLIETAPAPDGIWQPWSGVLTGGSGGLVISNLSASANPSPAQFFRVRVQ